MFNEMIFNIPITSEGVIVKFVVCPQHWLRNDISIRGFSIQHPPNLKEKDGAAQKKRLIFPD